MIKALSRYTVIKERMPIRHSTRRGYLVKLKIVLEKWGSSPLPLRPYEVEAWLKELKIAEGKLYSPKTLSHVRNMLTILHDAAMFWATCRWNVTP